MKIRFCVLLTATLAAAVTHAATVTASLDPSRIALGDSAQLSVTVSGDSPSDPILPSVNGLDFTPGGQSSSYQIINGSVSSSVSSLYQVTPSRAGTFTIPPIRLPGIGSSRPLVLQVLQKADNLGAASDSVNNAQATAAFLRIVLPKHELYVGEEVPVQVRAYFRAGMLASLNGLPVLNSDAFTINKLDDKPDQSRVDISGVPYTVLTWSTALSAVKSGDYSLNLELPVTVRAQLRRQHVPNPFKNFFGNTPFDDDSFFDDSFFDQFFGAETQKPLDLRTDAGAITVLPLPAAGRPADFSGAVGKFDLTSEVTPTQANQGDPLTLRLKIAGQGNFDRVTTRGLAGTAAWKTYQPSGHFESSDESGTEGTKTFEQAVIPLQAGSQNVPSVAFSYFDPDARQYVTQTTSATAVNVAPVANAPLAAATPPTPTVTTPAEGLAVNKIEAGHFVSSLRPILFAPWFIVLQVVPVIGLAAGLLLFRRRERLAHDPQYPERRARDAAIDTQLAAMDEAESANNAPAFFSAARQAVQERLAQRWHIPPGQVTLAEMNRRLNGEGGELQALFNMAGAVVYSRQFVSHEELERWKTVVVQQLKKLEAA